MLQPSSSSFCVLLSTITSLLHISQKLSWERFDFFWSATGLEMPSMKFSNSSISLTVFKSIRLGNQESSLGFACMMIWMLPPPSYVFLNSFLFITTIVPSGFLTSTSKSRFDSDHFLSSAFILFYKETFPYNCVMIVEVRTSGVQIVVWSSNSLKRRRLTPELMCKYGLKSYLRVHTILQYSCKPIYCVLLWNWTISQKHEKVRHECIIGNPHQPLF